MQSAPPQKPIWLWWLIGLAIIAAVILAYFYYTDSPISANRFLILVENWYVRYGYVTVFLAAFVEGLFPLNIYIPGSTSIVLGVVFAQRTGLSLPWFTALIILGFFLAYCVNYMTGRYGLHRLIERLGYGEVIKETEERLKKHGPKLLFGALVHSNLASITTTGAGIIRMPIYQFLSWTLAAVIIWDTLWVLGLMVVGEQLVNAASSWYALPILIIWGLIALVIWPKHKSPSTKLSKPD